VTRAFGRPLAALALVAALGLAGCTGEAPEPAPTTTEQPSASVADPSVAPSAAPTAAAPVLVPGGSAEQNLPFFAHVDALTAAGFDKSAMQVTADYSTIGNAAESIEFAVRLGDQCLVGQVGPSIGNPVTTVLPGLSSGGCLIGQTRTIDW
jgi:hypothetical protein